MSDREREGLALFVECPHDMRADETGGAGDQDFHRLPFSRERDMYYRNRESPKINVTLNSKYNHALLGGANHGLGAALGVQLGHDGIDMKLDGMFGDAQLHGDGSVGQALCQQLQTSSSRAVRGDACAGEMPARWPIARC